MTIARYGRWPNQGAWRRWPLRRIVERHPHGCTVIEVLECGHAQYEKAPIGGTSRPASRRCRRCAPL